MKKLNMTYADNLESQNLIIFHSIFCPFTHYTLLKVQRAQKCLASAISYLQIL